MNGLGNSGGFNVQGFDVGSISCNGGGAQRAQGGYDLQAGSPLSSGTVDTPASQTITSAQTNTDSITVLGVGVLAPPGNVIVYACGPLASAAGCTSSNPTTCTSSAGVSCVGTVALTQGVNGISTATSAAFTPTGTGYWCFAAYYQGDLVHGTYNASSDTSPDGCFSVSAPAAPPAPVITVPGNSACYVSSKHPTAPCTTWNGTMSGTATDPAGPGLSHVTITITNGGNYWNGSTWVSTVSSVTGNLTGPTGGLWSWTYSFPKSDFNGTGSYAVSVAATDTISQPGPPANATFQWNG